MWKDQRGSADLALLPYADLFNSKHGEPSITGTAVQLFLDPCSHCLSGLCCSSCIDPIIDSCSAERLGTRRRHDVEAAASKGERASSWTAARDVPTGTQNFDTYGAGNCFVLQVSRDCSYVNCCSCCGFLKRFMLLML